jgi:hypothetical protein
MTFGQTKEMEKKCNERSLPWQYQGKSWEIYWDLSERKCNENL